MNDWNNLVLGEEDSQTAPVCNGTVRKMIADIDRLKRYENIYRREFEAKQRLKAAEFEITELEGALSEVKRQLASASREGWEQCQMECVDIAEEHASNPSVGAVAEKIADAIAAMEYGGEK